MRDRSLVYSGERLHLVNPWKRHCGWEPAHFRRVVSDVLDRRASPWVGVLVTWGDDLAPGLDRASVSVGEFESSGLEQEVLYIVKPNPRPPVVPRHGSRRRRSG